MCWTLGTIEYVVRVKEVLKSSCDCHRIARETLVVGPLQGHEARHVVLNVRG
jgi:hypothetical protein